MHSVIYMLKMMKHKVPMCKIKDEKLKSSKRNWDCNDSYQ